MNYFSLFDIILLPFYLGIIYFFAIKKKNANIYTEVYFKHYVKGLTIKIIGGISVCLIYTFYYTAGGDTLNYFDSGIAMLNLMQKTPSVFFDIVFNGNNSYEQFSNFDMSTHWPSYWNDRCSFFFVRLTCFIVLISFRSYLVTTILIAWVSYSGIWRLYTVFCKEFPEIKDNLAIGLLMVPSVAFWGSGLLKDTITLSACCWFTFSFYNGIVKREAVVLNFITMLVSAYLIMAIKPYILYCLLPGAAIWLVSAFTSNAKKTMTKIVVFPLFFLLFVGGTYLLFQQIGNNLGKWSVDSVLERAVITQNDLVKDYYGGNTFDIGKFDATLPSMLRKSPAAIMAGLFRPFLWEARNPVMVISALENAFFIALSIYLLITLKIYKILFFAWRNPLLLYSLVFAIFFAFMVGLTTPNFGSLVRYRIPAIPFFISSLFILKNYCRKV